MIHAKAQTRTYTILYIEIQTHKQIYTGIHRHIQTHICKYRFYLKIHEQNNRSIRYIHRCKHVGLQIHGCKHIGLQTNGCKHKQTQAQTHTETCKLFDTQKHKLTNKA